MKKGLFGLGSNWLSNQMGTRNPAKVGEEADKAYWGDKSISNEEIKDKMNKFISPTKS